MWTELAGGWRCEKGRTPAEHLLTSILSLMDCVTRFPTQRFDWQGVWGPSRKAEPGETIFFADGKASPQLWAILDPQHQDFKKFGRIVAAHEA